MAQESKQRIDEYIHLLADVKINPKRILTDIYWSHYSNLMGQLIEYSPEFSKQEITLVDLQNYLYGILIPYLRKGLRDMTFSYDETLYPAFLAVEYNEVTLGYLDIYKHTFKVMPFSELEEARTELLRLLDELEEASNLLTEYQGYQQNIMSVAKNPIQKVDILLRSKHYKEKVSKKSLEALNNSVEIEKQIVSQKVTISRLEEYYLPFEEQQRLVSRHFKLNYAYRIINFNGEDINDNSRL